MVCLPVQLLLEGIEVADRLLEPVVLEHDRGLCGERLEKPQRVVPEHRPAALTVADEQQSEHSTLSVQWKRDRATKAE